MRSAKKHVLDRTPSTFTETYVNEVRSLHLERCGFAIHKVNVNAVTLYSIRGRWGRTGPITLTRAHAQLHLRVYLSMQMSGIATIVEIDLNESWRGGLHLGKRLFSINLFTAHFFLLHVTQRDS